MGSSIYQDTTVISPSKRPFLSFSFLVVGAEEEKPRSSLGVKNLLGLL